MTKDPLKIYAAREKKKKKENETKTKQTNKKPLAFAGQ